MREVFVARNAMLAHHVKALLDAAGIPSRVHGEGLASVVGGIQMDMSTMPSVWILDEADAERALEIIQRYEQGSRHESPGATWTCPSCGEAIEAQFAACWRCGEARQT